MFFNQKRKFTGLPFKTTLFATFGAILLIIPGTPVYAADTGLSTTGKTAPAASETITVNRDMTTVAGLCEHHAEHTAECLAGIPCSHTHTPECYLQVTRCVHVHSGACGKRSTSYRECSHVCSENNGCIISGLDCHHEHNEDCCYEDGSACSYSCGSCHENKQSSITSGNTYSSGRKSHHGSHHSRRHHG